MDTVLIGTGGTLGWPEEGCWCASCMRARAAGIQRRPGEVRLDGAVTLTPGRPPLAAPDVLSSYQITAVPGGWDITGPDGHRLLAAGGPGLVPRPYPDAGPYDLALLDLLATPAQLGELRAAGLVHPATQVAAMYADHRISSAAELARRCEIWHAVPAADGQVLSTARAQRRAGPIRPHRTLILGGARSGKSSEAELRLAAEPAVTYLAAGPWADETWTAADGEPDDEWAGRVAAHQAARPGWWRTEESLDIAGALARESGALLIDGIGTWLAAVMDAEGAWSADTAAPAAARINNRIDDLIAAWRQTTALVVAVSDQVGSGLVPVYPAGRAFRDQLGWLNQRLAAESDLTLLVVAGRITTLPD